ncbi:regulatory protein NB-ARC [Ilyonectria robusta]
MARVNDSFPEALRAFHAHFTPEERQDFRFSTPENLERSFREIENTAFRQRQNSVLNFVNSMRRYNDVMSVFVPSIPDMLISTIWGATKLVLEAASRSREAMEIVIDRFEEISENIGRINRIGIVVADDSMIRQYVQLIYLDVLEFHQCVIKQASKRGINSLRANRELKQQSAQIVASLRSHKQVLEAQFSIAQALKLQIIDQRAQDGHLEILQSRREKQLRTVLDWLRAKSSRALSEFHATPEHGFPLASSMLHDSPVIAHWRKKGFISPLWMTAIPGGGKSMSAAGLVGFLQANDTPVLYYNFEEMTVAPNRFLELASSLLEQMVLRNPDIVPFLFEQVASGRNSKYLLSITNLLPICFFLYAIYSMESLQSQPTRADLRREFEAITNGKHPKKLSIFYEALIDKTFSDLDSSEAKSAWKILDLICATKQVLSLDDLQVAFAFDSQTQTFDFEERMLRVDPRTLCGSLIRVDPSGLIDLFHPSLKRHFLSRGLASTKHYRQAEICLRQLDPIYAGSSNELEPGPSDHASYDTKSYSNPNLSELGHEKGRGREIGDESAMPNAISAIFLSDATVRALVLIAIRRSDIGQNKIQKRIVQILERLSSVPVQMSPRPDDRKLVWDMLQYHPGSISARIVSMAVSQFQSLPTAKFDAISSKSAEETSLVSVEDLESMTQDDTTEMEGEATSQTKTESRFQAMKQLFQDSEAVKKMRVELEAFLYPTFQAHLGVIADDVLARTPKAPQDDSMDIDPEVLYDLRNAVVSSINLSVSDRYNIFNELKGWFQAHTGQEWDWWPFLPYRRRLKSGEARLEWACNCGRQHEQVVTRKQAEYLAGIARRHSSLSSTESHEMRSMGMLSGGYMKSAGSLSSDVQGQRVLQVPVRPTSRSPQGLSARLHPSDTTSTESDDDDALLHIFLLVSCGDELKLGTLEVSSKLVTGVRPRNETVIRHTSDFFRQLKKKYIFLRGWRYYLSVWGYSGCEFHKLQRFRPSEFETLGKGYPDTSMQEYRFDPRPMTPDQPISCREFRSWFYTCDQKRLIHRLLHTCKEPCTTNDLLKLIPKRISDLTRETFERETFYGLLTREVPRIIVPLIYSLLILAPSLVFIFLWLLGWGHTDDLQNAVVPFSLSFALLPLLWGLIYTHLKGQSPTRELRDSVTR